MMKIISIIFLSLLTVTINAQPMAYEIRERIAEGVESLEIVPEPVYKISNKEISGGDYSIKVRLYYPSNQDSLPILYFIHGGGWIGGSLDTHDNLCRHLTNETNSIVLAIDYRRPPEYQYPVPLEDCYFILNWINQNLKELNGSGELYLIGDSSGGNLAASLAIKNIESDSRVNIKGQILINPATDLRDEIPKNEFVNWYVPKEIDKSNPFLSPITYNHFEKLPKSIVVVCEEDAIKQEGVQFHNLMLENGNSSVLFELNDVGHLGVHGAANSDVAKPAMDFVTSEILKWMEK